jgi:hypothetical protein
MRKALAVSLLLLAMSVSALGDGVMGNPVAAPPPPQSDTTQTGTATTDGVMGNPLAPTADATTAEAALSLLPTLLALV